VTWQIEPDEPAKTVCIRVHNGGDPIPAEVLSKLTQPFQTTKASGNGLGLAIARRIVEAHNGQLQIQSAATTGTIVSIHLPLLHCNQSRDRSLSITPES
jgi:signal transduction histidine kinase